jgi:hypothetical protein
VKSIQLACKDGTSWEFITLYCVKSSVASLEKTVLGSVKAGEFLD